MKYVIKLVPRMVFLVCLMAGAGVLGAAASSSSSSSVEIRPKDHAIVTNWPEYMKRMIWNTLGIRSRRQVCALIKPGGLLGAFPKELISLIISYLDFSAPTYSLEKGSASEPIYHIKVSVVKDKSRNEAVWRVSLYLCPKDKPHAALLKSFHITMEGAPLGTTHQLTLHCTDRTREIYGIKRLIAGKSRAIDCRIPNYNAEAEGGTILEWNAYDYDEELIQTHCILYGAIRSWDIQQKRSAFSAGIGEASSARPLKRPTALAEQKEKEERKKVKAIAQAAAQEARKNAAALAKKEAEKWTNSAEKDYFGLGRIVDKIDAYGNRFKVHENDLVAWELGMSFDAWRAHTLAHTSL